MVTPGRIEPSQQDDSAKRVSRSDRAERPTPVIDDGSKKEKFKTALKRAQERDKGTEEVEVEGTLSQVEEKDARSPFDLAMKMGNKKTKKADEEQSAFAIEGQEDDTDISLEQLTADQVRERKKSLAEKREKLDTFVDLGNQGKQGSEVQSNMSAQPTARADIQGLSGLSSSVDQTAAARESRRIAIQLIEQLTKALVQEVKSDRTEISVTLRSPPGFENVTLTMTEYNTSKKEFNLTFFNLTDQAARDFVASRQNQELLRSALIEKGYTLQMVTMEPKIIEGLTIKTESSEAEHGREQDEDLSGRQDSATTG